MSFYNTTEIIHKWNLSLNDIVTPKVARHLVTNSKMRLLRIGYKQSGTVSADTTIQVSRENLDGTYTVIDWAEYIVPTTAVDGCFVCKHYDQINDTVIPSNCRLKIESLAGGAGSCDLDIIVEMERVI